MRGRHRERGRQTHSTDTEGDREKDTHSSDTERGRQREGDRERETGRGRQIHIQYRH